MVVRLDANDKSRLEAITGFLLVLAPRPNNKIVDKCQQLQEVLVVLEICHSTYRKEVRSLEYICFFLFKKGQLIQ